jgi:hypothetical protein
MLFEHLAAPGVNLALPEAAHTCAVKGKIEATDSGE